MILVLMHAHSQQERTSCEDGCLTTTDCCFLHSVSFFFILFFFSFLSLSGKSSAPREREKEEKDGGGDSGMEKEKKAFLFLLFYLFPKRRRKRQNNLGNGERQSPVRSNFPNTEIKKSFFPSDFQGLPENMSLLFRSGSWGRGATAVQIFLQLFFFLPSPSFSLN